MIQIPEKYQDPIRGMAIGLALGGLILLVLIGLGAAFGLRGGFYGF